MKENIQWFFCNNQANQSFIYIIKSKMQLWENKITFVFRHLKSNIKHTGNKRKQTAKKKLKWQEWLKDITELTVPLTPSPACAQHWPLAFPFKYQLYKHN